MPENISIKAPTVVSAELFVRQLPTNIDGLKSAALTLKRIRSVVGLFFFLDISVDRFALNVLLRYFLGPTTICLI